MLNFAGQHINKGDYIGQVSRTNKGLARRVGVVMGEVEVETPRLTANGLRVIWATLYGTEWELSNGNVLPDSVFRIDGDTITYTTFLQLDAARRRGHA